jgi:tetratricopeptide (TPR) repeat protein
MNDLRKIDVNNTTDPTSQKENTKLKDKRPDYFAAAPSVEDAGHPPRSNDPLARANCRALARAVVAEKLGLEPECVRSRGDGHPYLALKVPESLPAKKRFQDFVALYHAGVEAEKQLYGLYTGDGSGEVEDLAHEFHLEIKGDAADAKNSGETAQAEDGNNSQAPQAAYKKGDVIGGQYEVHSLLGRGGFGEVYLAYNREYRMPFALKTFRQKFLADAEMKENFKREALLWVNLEEHPFILAARGVEDVSSRLFVRMDYIAPDDRGRVSLADHLARTQGPLDTDQALLWASMFCYGMEHANQRGIKCHRDIKPANILIRQDGTLLIGDFGLAAAAEAAWKGRGGSWQGDGEESFVGLSIFTTAGKQACGTPGYIAPEVFRGEGADVRSDIYSFGLVMWQMAAGSQVSPFAVGVPRGIDRYRYAREIYNRQTRERAPTVGEPFETVIERCLDPEPSKRFASFTQLRAELELILLRRSGQTVKLPRIGERSAAFWSNKGFSLLTLGRHDEAVASFRKALQMDPDLAIAHNNLGNALAEKGNLDAAISEWRTAVRLQPDLTMAHTNLGKALGEKGDLDGAIAECHAALRIQPDDANAHNNLGNALHAKGDLDGAVAEYRTAVRLQPDFARAHNNLGNALCVKGDLDGAMAECRTALRIQPDFALAHNNLGNALYVKRDVDGAIAEYRTALRLQADDANARNNLGNALYDKGDLDGAIAEYRTALRLQPDDAHAHSNLGNALYVKRDLDGAIAEYRAALRLRPDDANAHKYLGDALWTKGDREAALEEVQRAYSIAPSDPTIRQTYENLMRQLKR